MSILLVTRLLDHCYKMHLITGHPSTSTVFKKILSLLQDKDKLCQFIQDNNENESLVNSINTCFENFAVTEVSRNCLLLWGERCT